jgi:hypothetical protein
MLTPSTLSRVVGRMRRPFTALLLLSGLAAGGLAGGSAAARTTRSHVPQGFVGMNIDGPLFWPNTTLNLSDQMSSMVSHGVQSVRAGFDWATAQPYASWSDVPANQRSNFVTGPAGRPISYSATDTIVANAGRRRLTIMPIVLYAPLWDRKVSRGSTVPTPKNVTPYAQYAAALVRRYGPRGSFWAANPSIPKVPIRQWQIWNEPNILYFWPQPFGAGYVRLLRAAHNAIKRADPHAQIVLAALTNYAWNSIQQIYSVRGGRKLFDVVSVDGYTRDPARDILYLQIMRRALDHYKDRHKPIVATEFGWPSAVGRTPTHGDFNTTVNKQATYTARFLHLASQQRVKLGLSAVYYYDWINNEYRGAPVFNFSGLQNYDNQGGVHAKPSLAAFGQAALAIEGCRAKGATATQCRH